MKIEYKSKKLEKSLTDDREIIKQYGKYAKKVKQRMVALQEAESLSVIKKLPTMHLHPYKGARLGEWSIDIIKNWRICFWLNHDPIPMREDNSVEIESITAIKISSVEDPH
ncbi:MAG: plasmid maintenance system killer protein [Arenicella sp.]|jgi:plasmid maintenance system killer protein